MPYPRILLAAALALVLLLATLWAMDVNYAAWIGAWLTPNNQYITGLGVLITFAVLLAVGWGRWLSNFFPGPGPIRGVLFGAILAVGAIWVLPYMLNGFAAIIGNTQVVYQGRGITNDTETFDQRIARTEVEPCPPIGGVKPPLSDLTKDHEWAPADAWVGRLLPFSMAFLLYGLALGALISDEKRGVQ